MQFLDRYVSQRNANTSHARERAPASDDCTRRDTIIALDRHGLVTSLKSSLSNFYLAGLCSPNGQRDENKRKRRRYISSHYGVTRRGASPRAENFNLFRAIGAKPSQERRRIGSSSVSLFAGSSADLRALFALPSPICRAAFGPASGPAFCTTSVRLCPIARATRR